MDEYLSAAAVRALEFARRLAAQRSANRTSPADLLCALLLDRESEACSLLRRHGVDIEQVLVQLGDSANADLSDDAPAAELGSELHAIIAGAKQFSLLATRYEQVGSEELLVALLQEWTGASQSIAVASAVIDEYLAEREPKTVSIPLDELDIRLGEAVERTDLARMVDANANRVRESLRVLEDYVRFALDDERLSRELKECRHSFRSALDFLPAEWLILSRDTPGDVGTRITTASETARADLHAVVVANCKRAQESLRTLEECAKTQSVSAARVLEQLRYRFYDIERSLAIGRRTHGRLEGVCLYWLLDPEACSASIEWMIEQAAFGGVQVVQLRDKKSPDRELVELARRVRRAASAHKLVFIMNDRPDLARLANADGVHVGQDELSVRDARRIVGPEALIGVSTHTIEQARQAVSDGADYIGVGPCFPSKTKNFAAFAGLDFVREVSAEISLPTFAIGGIDLSNVADVIAAGARRIAVGHAISNEREPAAVARSIRYALP